MKNLTFRKFVAWVLLVAMGNPFALMPAYALDSDIFLMTTPGSAAPEPNVLIILDTSDSMNLAEAWREYPGAYDSHVEYLWADMNLISNAEVPAENANSISTAALPSITTSKWGFWAGATLADRQALWTAARNSANAAFGSDPGPRRQYRNYNDLSWYYWSLASEAANEDTDFRLWSVSFNRFRGYRWEVGGARGGITYTSSPNFESRNQCETSKPHLVPSTVIAPSGYAQNAGKFTGSNWKRWNKYQNLDSVNNGSYNILGQTAIAPFYARSYLDHGVAPPNNPVTDNTSWGGMPGDWGLPIRTQKAPSFAGWEDLGADMGGFYYVTMIGGQIYHYYLGLSGTNGYAAVMGELQTRYGIPNIGGTFANLMKGNRDAPPADFSKVAGANFYYDIPANPFPTCNPVTGPASAHCINVPTGGSAGTTVYKTRSCARSGGSSEVDAIGVTRLRNGTCEASPNDGDANCNDQLGSCQCTSAVVADCLTVANPPACSMNLGNVFINQDNRNCAWRPGRSTVSIGTCTWSGRSSVYVEGVGMYYYGGTCTESGSPDSCQITGTTTTAINGVVQSYVTGPYAYPGSPAAAAAGCSNLPGRPAGTWYYGGACEGQQNTVGTIPGTPASILPGVGSYSNAYCNNTATASVTIRGTAYADVWFGSATGGCSDKADNDQTCRPGGASRYNQWCDHPTNACPNQSTSNVVGASGSTPRYYAVYNRAQCGGASGGWSCLTTASYPGGHHWSMTVPWAPTWPTGQQLEDDWFAVHDCLADDGTGGNPGGNYLRETPKPGLGTQWNNGIGDVYTGPGNAYAPDPAKDITVYSVNYLNWKFGPRGPNGHPIGRKTRLQTAKSALSAIVNATDGVRIGLMAFNRTAGCTATSAVTADGSNVLTEAVEVGFTVGQSVRVLAVGNNPGTSDLVTTITAIDTGAGTITLGANAQNARSTTIQAEPCSSASRSNEGAFIAQQVVPMGSGATPEKAALVNAINGLTAAARTPLTESLYEAYRYFSGRVPRWGTSITPAAVGGVVTQGRDVNAVCSGGVTTECPFGNGFYKSPMMSNPNATTPATCQKNYIILITDGGPEDDWGANAAVKSMEWAGPTGTVSPRTTLDATNADTATAQFETAGVPYGPTDRASTTFDGGYIWLDELAHFLFAADVSPGAQNFATDPGAGDRLGGKQGVRTFTIGFAGGSSPVLSNAAAAGSGSYYVAEDSAALSAALIGALGDIVAWTPTFAAPSVPLSVLNRSQNAADVYLAFFEPDASQAWNGTVKRFRISVNPTLCGAGTEGCFIGQTDLGGGLFNIEDSQVDPVSGATNVFVNDDAVSFWLPTTEQDGGSPKKGGTGYVLKNTVGYDPSNRKVYTYLAEAAATSPTNVLANAGNAVTEANAGLITKTLLGNPGMTDLERSNLINFIRGGDIAAAGCNDSDTGTACTAWRAWAHFDVQHSRPAIVQYDGTAIADPAIPGAITAVEGAASRATAEYLYYVSNDGLLHAVDTLDGTEKWTFLIEEAFAKIAGMKNDNSASQLFVADGSPAIYVKDNNGNGVVETGDGDKVWIYFGLRRGGRVYYALDITEKDNPKFMWKISSEGGTGRVCNTTSCTAVANFNELGQSWSTPVIAKVRAIGAADPVLIFAGGYDPLQDNVPPAAPADTMGRALYVVRGDDATIVGHWKSGGGGGALTINSGSMSYSIPSDVTALNMDLDATGYIDRLYVGDMGGQVWRFDVDDVNPANWRAKVLANLSDAALPKRKVFFPPAVAKQNYAGRFDAVYVGTGDREKPLCLPAASVTVGSQTFANPCAGLVAYDRMFMVMDPAVGNTMNGDAAYSMAAADFALLTSNQVAGADLTGKKGWSRALESGEKVTGSPTVFFNVLRFGTYAPLGQSVSCAPLGEGRLNEIGGEYGQLRDLTGNGVISAGERYYTSYLSHGYVSSGQAIIIGNAVYHVVVQSGVPRLQRIATIGVPNRIFWYMQPER